MTTTRLVLRQAIAKETGLGTLVTTDTAGSTTTLIDSTSTLKGAYSASRFARGSPVRFTTLGGVAASTEGSTVSDYNPATGTITILPAATTDTHSADICEIWQGIDSVKRVDEAIDRALTTNCWQWIITAVGVTPATGETYTANITRRFLLPATVLSPEYVGEIYVRYGTSTDNYTYEPYVQYGRTVGLTSLAGGVVIEFDIAPSTTEPLYFELLTPYAALATDVATTTCPLDLALWSSIYQLYSHMARPDMTSESKSGYITASDAVRLRDEAQRRMNLAQRQYGAAPRQVFR